MYYQPKPYFTGDKIQIFKLSDKFEQSLNSDIAMYLISTMKKAFQNFLWGQQSFSIEKIANMQINLPIKASGEPDFAYMEKYIKAIQKMIIKDVVKYKDKVISTTKRIVN